MVQISDDYPKTEPVVRKVHLTLDKQLFDFAKKGISLNNQISRHELNNLGHLSFSYNQDKYNYQNLVYSTFAVL